MTVKELIEALQTMPPDARVRAAFSPCGSENYYETVEGIVLRDKSFCDYVSPGDIWEIQEFPGPYVEIV